ncbi:MAG: GIY-YIG nuclease family protein [Candidatus Aminicenantes bacterium]|nr:GIY-YIG nuclease family protein [Candidatus Aminicenantes bacterium]
MSNNDVGYHEDPKNGNGIIRARTTKQIRSWEIPRTSKALEKLNEEMGKIGFPGNYILFDNMKVYIGEAKNIYNRLKNHSSNPDDKIRNWSKALVISDGRPASQSDFNDNVVRLALELHLIRMFRANKYRVVSQGQKITLNPIQKHIVSSLMQELNHFLLKKNIINKVLEDEGLEEIFADELRRLLAKTGKKVQKLTAHEATIDDQKVYIRPGSEKSKGWQITFRDRFLNSLQNGNGYLLVSRGGVLFIPLKEVQRVIADRKAYEQNTIDVYIVFAPEKVTLTYKQNTIDVTSFKLRG